MQSPHPWAWVQDHSMWQQKDQLHLISVNIHNHSLGARLNTNAGCSPRPSGKGLAPHGANAYVRTFPGCLTYIPSPKPHHTWVQVGIVPTLQVSNQRLQEFSHLAKGSTAKWWSWDLNSDPITFHYLTLLCSPEQVRMGGAAPSPRLCSRLCQFP